MLPEACQAPYVGLLRTESPDIKAVAGEDVNERGVVDLRIVGEGHERGVVVDVQRGQHGVRPISNHHNVGKSLAGGECSAGIYDCHVIAQQLGDWAQRLADVNGAGDDKAAVPFDSHLHAGIIGLDHECAAWREYADHCATQVSHASGFRESDAAEQNEEDGSSDGPAAPTLPPYAQPLSAKVGGGHPLRHRLFHNFDFSRD